MNNNKSKAVKIILSAVLLAAAYAVNIIAELPVFIKLLTYLPAYAVVAYEVIVEAFEGLFEGELFGEEFLMTVATVGAFVIGFLPDGTEMFGEGVFVMLFFQLGELFEHIAEDKSRRSVASLMDIRPDSANLYKDGEIFTVHPDKVKIGQIILVRSGERIPLDGIVIDGKSSLNTVSITGESIPSEVDVGDSVVSGCINNGGILKIRTTKEFGESTVSKILSLVENASERKSKNEKFIAKFAHIYTPAVVFVAIILALGPSLLFGEASKWIVRALTFLIVSCPCALVMSVPLSYFCGIGFASKHGILIKGSDYMEVLAGIDTVAFDKTGTLTKGVFSVTDIHPTESDKNTLLHLAAHAERYSVHPIALSVREAYPNEQDGCELYGHTEIAGKGVVATVNGKKISIGNTLLMDDVGAKWENCDCFGTVLHVAIDGKYAGHIVVSDVIKEDAPTAIKKLKALGINNMVMLTGDRFESAKNVAKELGVDGFEAGLLPYQKVSVLEKLAENSKNGVAFVGDGTNDAPVLARADVGVAMGGFGSDAAIEAADVIIMDDKPSKLCEAVEIARYTKKTVKQNIFLALFFKFGVLALTAVGLAPMWLAVFSDVGVTVLAVLNAIKISEKR